MPPGASASLLGTPLLYVTFFWYLRHCGKAPWSVASLKYMMEFPEGRYPWSMGDAGSAVFGASWRQVE